MWGIGTVVQKKGGEACVMHAPHWAHSRTTFVWQGMRNSHRPWRRASTQWTFSGRHRNFAPKEGQIHRRVSRRSNILSPCHGPRRGRVWCSRLDPLGPVVLVGQQSPGHGLILTDKTMLDCQVPCMAQVGDGPQAFLPEFGVRQFLLLHHRRW